MQERPRGATLHPRSGGAAERRYPVSEVKGSSWKKIPQAPKPEARGGGREEPPHAGGQGWWRGGPTPRPGSYPVRAQEGLEELSHIEGQEGWR